MIVFNDKYRIRKHDNYNITVERYNKVIGKITKEERFEWQIEAYVNTVNQALQFVKKLILEDGMDLTNNLEDFINYCEQYKLGVETKYENKEN